MPKLGLGASLIKNNSRVAAFRAIGDGLSPNINGMLFYEIGTFTFGTKKLYPSDEGYFVFNSGTTWIISNQRDSASRGWSQPGLSFFNQPDASIAFSIPFGGFTGTVTLVTP